MRIETDRVLITTEPYNFVVKFKHVKQDHKWLKDKSSIGGLVLGDKRYYGTLDKLFYGLIEDALINDEQIQNLDEIKTLIHSYGKEIKEAIK